MLELRELGVQSDRLRFRRNLERLGAVMAYEISKTLESRPQTVQTALGEAEGSTLLQTPVLAVILRAGLPLHQGLLGFFDKADCAFVASYRKHHRDGSFEIAQQYLTSPPVEGRDLIVVDTMLATGASQVLAIKGLLASGTPRSLHIAAAISCNVGLEAVLRRYSEAQVWTGDIDDELTAKGYIVPGLGDAGDLAYGGKQQF